MEITPSDAPQTDTETLTRAVLDLLQTTHEFYNVARHGSMLGSYALPGYSTQFQEVMEASRTEVNTCLELLGGLAVRFVGEADAHYELTHVLTKWHGYDSKEPGRLLWGVAGRPNSVVSLELGTLVSSLVMPQQPAP